MPHAAYVIQTVDRSAIGDKDWLYVRQPDGRLTFLMANDARIAWDCERTLAVLGLITDDVKRRVA